MRFHSIIFSMMKVPAVALIYDTKTVELLKRRGNEHRCVSIMLSELDADKLKSKINKLLG